MLKIVQVGLCEYRQKGRKPIRQELRRKMMSRIGELSMEALMLVEQVEHTPWKQEQRALQAERVSRAHVTMFVCVGGGSNVSLCLTQRIYKGNAGDQPRRVGVRWPMENLDCWIRLWFLFWKQMESLEFFEQVRAVLAKINLAVPGQ